MVELITKWKRACRELEEELGRQPNVKELSVRLELPEKKIKIIRKAVKASRRPTQPGGGGDDESPGLGEMLEDFRHPSPHDAVMLEDEIDTVTQLLEAIDDREATILRLRYGLEGEEPMTLKEIGTHVGLTRERVRQIEIEALRKLNARMNSDHPLGAVWMRRTHARAMA